MAAMQITQEQLSAAIAGDREAKKRTAGPTDKVLRTKDLLRKTDLLRTKGDPVSL